MNLKKIIILSEYMNCREMVNIKKAFKFKSKGNSQHDRVHNNIIEDTNKFNYSELQNNLTHTTGTNKEDIKKFELKNYCESNFLSSKKTNLAKETNMKLKKFIVINRHGDRMPIKYEQKDLFSFINCIKCLDETCTTNICREGDLTEKGYEQMEKLGKHISEEYEEILINIKKEEINLRTTVVERTKNSLHGILKGLKEGLIKKGKYILFDHEMKMNAFDNLNDSLIEEAINDIFPFINDIKDIKTVTPEVDVDSLLNLKNCKAYNKIINASIGTIPVLENIDESLVAMCNNIYEPCEKYSCDESYKNKQIIEYFNAWKEHGKAIRNNNFLTKIYFGRFAKDLLDFIDGKKKMQIISSHDNSLSLILAGLKTNFIEKPPLGSAIFLEIWEDSGNKEFLRIIFNNKILKSDIFNNVNIPLSVFREYVGIMNIDQNDLKSMCKLT